MDLFTLGLLQKIPSGSGNTVIDVIIDAILSETSENPVQNIADIINGAPSTLDTLSEIATAMDENKSVVDALDKAIGTKANKADIPNKLF